MYLNLDTLFLKVNTEARLTLTWDVFKSIYLMKIGIILSRLTLTWDVFKY